MEKRPPTVRLHLWLETPQGVFFGSGRAQLLERIDHFGSLKKAAEDMGMSYRAAWGKIRQSEKILGVRLVELTGTKRNYSLSDAGRMLKEKFKLWYDAVEQEALRKAEELFPWKPQPYSKDAPSDARQDGARGNEKAA